MQHRLNRSVDLPLIVVGGGGHAKVLVSTLLLQQRRIIGFADINSTLSPLLGVGYLGDDEAVFRHSPNEVLLINGVGSVGSTDSRRMVYEKFRKRGYCFESVIHPSAIIAPEVQIEAGVQLMAGVVIQPGVLLGEDSIVNTGARVDHDCVVGPHVHLAPGVTLSGNVRVEEGAHIGTGACVIQGVRVGQAGLVGAGAVVISDVPARETVVGVPARSVARQLASR